MSHRFVYAPGHALVTLVAAGLLGAVAGCQTAAPPPPEPETPEPGTMVEFQPAWYVSPLVHEVGEYPNLFSGDSFAVWVTPDVADAKHDAAMEAGDPVDPALESDAAEVLAQFVVLELHIESAFGDPSIAYDVVNLRNVKTYLEMPDGRQVAALQRVPLGGLSEAQEGALKQYRRTHLLLFPRRDLWYGGRVLDPEYPAVKLALQAYDTRHAFEWPGLPYRDPETVAVRDQRLRAVATTFQDVFSALRRAAHVFD